MILDVKELQTNPEDKLHQEHHHQGDDGHHLLDTGDLYLLDRGDLFHQGRGDLLHQGLEGLHLQGLCLLVGEGLPLPLLEDGDVHLLCPGEGHHHPIDLNPQVEGEGECLEHQKEDTEDLQAMMGQGIAVQDHHLMNVPEQEEPHHLMPGRDILAGLLPLLVVVERENDHPLQLQDIRRGDNRGHLLERDGQQDVVGMELVVNTLPLKDGERNQEEAEM